MGVTIKSERELSIMRIAGRIVANALQELRGAVEPGITTKELDALAERAVRREGAAPSFPRMYQFPGTVCASVNEEIVHGIPGKRRLRTGDLVKLDVGAFYDGFHGDAAVTVPVGTVSHEVQRLVDVTEQALAVGIEVVRPGAHVHDIGAAIQDWVEPRGFALVRQYTGHGLGRSLHEDPSVPHFRQATRGIELRAGMTLTIEPMVNAGTFNTKTLRDGWTVVTADGKLSAQWEHSIAVTEDGVEILTLPTTGSSWAVPAGMLEQVY